MGQARYGKELDLEPGTWFFTPGWAELGMEFVLHELQVQHMAEKGVDPLRVAWRMLDGFKRALVIDSGVSKRKVIGTKAADIAAEFNL
jgi:hypothetical protein